MNFRMLRFTCAATLVLLLSAAAASAQERAPRPTLTVANFATDRTGWMPPPHFGETLAEILTDRLVTAGVFRMIDREWLVATPRGDGDAPFAMLQARAAQAGVDYVVMGSVTRLSIEKRSSTGVGVVPLPIVGGLIRKHTTEQAIGLTLRVIAVGTGEVVASATAESSSSHRQTAGGGLALVGPAPIIGGVGRSTTGVQDRLLDAAIQQAISQAADQIVAKLTFP